MIKILSDLVFGLGDIFICAFTLRYPFPMNRYELQIELAKIEVEKMRLELNDKDRKTQELSKPQ